MLETDRKWLLVGISGVTCAGKTTLTAALAAYLRSPANARSLHKRMQIGRTHVINQDQYFLAEDDERHQRIPELGHNNWELTSALDCDQMLADIDEIVGGPGKANLLQMDAVRAGKVALPEKLDVLIVEGFVIFNVPELLERCHLKFHLHLPFEKCFERRKRRTYDPPDVVGYFERCVWPMYMRNYEEYRNDGELMVLNGELPTERMCAFVVRTMRGLVAADGKRLAASAASDVEMH